MTPSPDDDNAAAALRREAEQFVWYHCMDLGHGVVTDGIYDMTQYLAYYQFPDSMAGLRVLDVGRASGFFSFEFERRGAEVEATEVASFWDYDFVGGELTRERLKREIVDPKRHLERNMSGAFDLAHRLRGSSVKKRAMTIYQAAPQLFDRPFDLIFVGSVTSHLRDPVLAFERLRSVIAPTGVCIVAAPYIGLDESLPLAAMVGTVDPIQRSWWVVNRKCLTEMLNCAGFSRVDIVSTFTLKHRKDSKSEFPHIVAHARI